MGLSMRRVNDDPYFEQYDWEESDQLAEPEDSAEDSES
jgi:hypothetical protein